VIDGILFPNKKDRLIFPNKKFFREKSIIYRFEKIIGMPFHPEKQKHRWVESIAILTYKKSILPTKKSICAGITKTRNDNSMAK